MDDRFADKFGSIRAILKNVSEMDVSRGKLYDKLEKMLFELEHASYLLQELQAEEKLHADINLVGPLVRKLPSD